MVNSLTIMVQAVATLLLFASCSLPEPEQKTKITYPENQEIFISTITKYSATYDPNSNDLLASKIKRARNQELKTILANKRTIVSWIGIISGISSVDDKYAHVDIKLPETNIMIGTWNYSFSDFFDNTLIPQGTTIYENLSTLASGDTVVFSGRFISSADDFIKECSATRRGSILEPDFIFHFTSIERYSIANLNKDTTKSNSTNKQQP